MKRIISCILVFCMISSFICTIPAMAEDETFVYGEFLYQIPTWNDSICQIVGLNADVEDLVIPGVINGLQVFELESMAFSETDIKTVTIEEGVIYTGNNAFSDCNNLTVCTLPKSLKGIQYGAFSNCKNLETVIIQNAKTVIGEYAFYGSNVKDVYFAGNEQDWKMIRATSSDGLDNATVHFNYKVEETKNITVYLNNKQISFDVPPVVENGRTLVPVRAVLERMGLVVGWDQETASVTASGNGDRILMKINEHYITVNGMQHYIDTAPKVIDGRTMIPIRLVIEWIGASVFWANETRAVYIDYNPKRRIMLKDENSENYCYDMDENVIYIRPYQYASIVVTDKYGMSVYAQEDFVVKSRDNKNYVKVDEYNTLSAKVERGVEYLELWDKNERYWSSVRVDITDEYDYTGYSIKLRDSNVNSKAVQFDHCPGYKGMFETSNRIYIRPNQSVAVIGTYSSGEKISDLEMQNYKWISKNEFCTIDQYGTLSGASKPGNGEIQLVDKNTGKVMCRALVHNFDKSSQFILPFVNANEKEQTYHYLNENLLMRYMTYEETKDGCKVSFEMCNGWMIPVQISVYDENNNQKYCYITGSSWVDTGISNGVIDAFKGMPIFIDLATGKAWEGDYVVPTSDASIDKFELTVPYGGYIAVEYPYIKDGIANEAMKATVADMSLKCYLMALAEGGIVTSITGKQLDTVLDFVSDKMLESMIENVTAFEVDIIMENLRKSLSDDTMQKAWQRVFMEVSTEMAESTLKSTIDTAVTTWSGIGTAYDLFITGADIIQLNSEVRQLIQAKNMDDPTIHVFLAPQK